MTKSELVTQVADGAKITKLAAGIVVETILSAVGENEKVLLPGFGTFHQKTRKERMGRNPRTGADLLIPAKTAITFKSSKDLIESLN